LHAGNDRKGIRPVNSPIAKDRFATSSVLHDDRFDRDLSDLAYIERILVQARRADVPLGERLRFLAIVTSVLDEFLAVRLPKTAVAALPCVHAGVVQLRERQLRALAATIDSLRERGFHFLFDNGSNQADTVAQEIFSTQVLPILTPLAIDAEHPFPHLDHGECAFFVQPAAPRPGAGESRYVVVRLPPSLRTSALAIHEIGGMRVPAETLLRQHAELLIGEPIAHISMFRVYRENDLNLAPEFGDLREAVEGGLHLRPRNPVVAIETDLDMAGSLLSSLREELAGEREPFVFPSAFPGAGPLPALVEDLVAWAGENGADDLFFSSRLPRKNPLWARYADPFEAIRAGDVLAHWPYEGFDTLLNLLHAAAADPDVVAIRQTLYRTDESIAQPLIDAARRGAEVTVVFELEARENERHNIELSHQLQAAGAHVVYGVIGLKVHAKLLLVTRREGRGLMNYANVSTGNYHPGNAAYYADLCMFTCDAGIGRDVLALFNYVTGHLRAPSLERIAMAPHGLRDAVLQRIDREAAHARAGRPAAIWLKLNSLLDEVVCAALREASAAGVEIHAVVRRHCALLPEIDSDRLRITSLIGRVLEHSRILCFANGGPMTGPQAEVFLSSADWMPRNFDERVEVIVPVDDQTLRQHLVVDVMRANLDDRAQSWELGSDGRYRPVAEFGDGFCAQSFFVEGAGACRSA
jgi:polyphosphate kinase